MRSTEYSLIRFIQNLNDSQVISCSVWAQHFFRETDLWKFHWDVFFIFLFNFFFRISRSNQWKPKPKHPPIIAGGQGYASFLLFKASSWWLLCKCVFWVSLLTHELIKSLEKGKMMRVKRGEKFRVRACDPSISYASELIDSFYRCKTMMSKSCM